MFTRQPKLCVYNGIHTGLNVNVRRYFSPVYIWIQVLVDITHMTLAAMHEWIVLTAGTGIC